MKYRELSENNYWYTNAKPSLLMRYEPNQQSKIICSIPFAKRIRVFKIYEKEFIINNMIGKWVYVEYIGKRGWVFSGYLLDSYEVFSKTKIDLNMNNAIDYVKVKIKITIPHGPFFIIINPDGKQFYIVCPYHECEKKPLFKFNDFTSIDEFEIDIKTLIATPRSYNASPEKVFFKNGRYKLVIADNWDSGLARYTEKIFDLKIKSKQN
jgi:hypothetical protein